MKTIKKTKKPVKKTVTSKKRIKKVKPKQVEQCCHCCSDSDGMSSLSALIISIAVIVLVIGTFLTYKYLLVPDQEITAEEQTANWQVYSNEENGYEIKYPEGSGLLEMRETRINFPFDENTSLEEKYALIIVNQGIECINSMGIKIDSTDVIYFDDVEFKIEKGIQNAGDSTYEYISYSTLDQERCFSINFVLHYINEDFDKDKELEVINLMLSTFKIL